MLFNRVAAVAVALVLVSACDETPLDPAPSDVAPAFARGGVPGSGIMVSGSGHLVDTRLGGDGFRNFSFTARSDGGQFQIVNRSFDANIHGTVDCVSVNGNRAWFAGTVTESNYPDIPVGAVRAYYVVDNGEGAGDPPDEIAHGVTLVTITAQVWCNAQPQRVLMPIEQGNIQVSQGGGTVAFTDIVTFPTDLYVFVPCAADGAGEVVHLSGDLHYQYHVTINDNHVSGRDATHPQGLSGEGLTTGDQYQGTGITESTYGGSLVNGQYSTTYINNFRIIGQGPGNNLLMHSTVHMTVNANGEITAYADNYTSDCR